MVIELGGGGGCLAGVLAKKLGLKSKALVLIEKSPEGKKAWEEFSGFGCLASFKKKINDWWARKGG